MSLSINPVNWSENTKKNTVTIGTLAIAGAGASAISKTTKGKSYAWNSAINKPLKNFVKSEKKFFGSDILKDLAGKIAKTSARQKLLGFLAVDTLGAVMVLREHFSKENGKEIQKKQDNNLIKAMDKQIDIKDKKLEAQNNYINTLEARLTVADCEINGYKQTLKEIDKAAQNIGVDKDLAQELQKMNG